MKTSLFTLLLALWLLPHPVWSAPSALPPPGRIPDSLGVNIHFTGAPARDLEGLQKGGFHWARMDFVWNSIEKTKGVYDFAAYDMLLKGLNEHEMHPLFILDYGNDLYQQGSPRSPEAQAAFARFAAAAVKHYKGRQILWEIWNEPNIGFWKPQPNVEEYGSLALATAQAIKAADPNATVLAAGTSTISLPFFESLFKRGLLRYIDAVSFHPYRGSNPETAAVEYAQLRQLITHYAHGKEMPLVSSEWGYSTTNVSEQTQAQYLARQWLSNIAEGIRVSIWYDWHDDGTDPKNAEHNFGTVHNDYTPKPAYLAAQALTHALTGYTFVKRLSLDSDKDYLLLFRQGKSVKLAAWTTGDTHDVSLPLSGPTQAESLLDGTVQALPGDAAIRVTLSGSPQALSPSPAATATLLRAASWTVKAKSPTYTSGQPLALTAAFTAEDTGKRRAQFSAAFSTAGSSVPVTITSPSALLKPGQTLQQTLTTKRLARVPVRANVTLILDGKPQPFTQSIQFTPTDPVTLSVAPNGAHGFTVQIENPAGTPFTGTLTSQTTAKTVPVKIGKGQTALTLPAPGAPAKMTAWTLTDQTNRVVAKLSAQRFVPYPVAWTDVRAIKDGDEKLEWELIAAPAPDAFTVTYAFVPGWTFWRAAETSPQALPGKPIALGLWVKGDGSGNLVRMRFRDVTGQTFQPDGDTMTWTGWRWVTFPFTDGNRGHWGGANDGVVHSPITVDSLFLLDNPSGSKHLKGAVTLRQPSLIYTTP